MRHATALLFAACLATVPATAQVISEGVAQGGLICDSPQEVAQAIALIETEGVQAAITKIDGCGILTRPMMLRMSVHSKVSGSKGMYLVVEYEFVGTEMPKQYGIGSFKALTSL